MKTIHHKLLDEVIALIDKQAIDQAVTLWREEVSRDVANCQACPYEHMTGRRCCCLCLESCLSNTSLCFNFDTTENERIRTAERAIKSYRFEKCLRCASVED